MAVSVRITRLLGAVALSAALVGGVLVITSPNFSLSFLHSGIANAASTATVLAAYAQKDTDADGLPDWEEALYGTDPHNAHSVSQTLTDGEAVAQGMVTPKAAGTDASSTPADIEASIPGQLPADGSLTQQFAQEFFTQVVQNSNGTTLTSDQEQSIVSQLLSNYTDRAQALIDSPYSTVDIHTDANISLSAYSAGFEKLALENTPDTGGAATIDLIQNWLVNNDASAKVGISNLAKTYASMAQGLAAMHVPPAQAANHLKLLQSFDTLARSMTVIANYQDDPLATMGGISEILPQSKKMNEGIQGLASDILVTGEPAAGTPGALIVEEARSLKGS